MLISRRWMTGLLALTMAAGACLGEEPAVQAKFYKLEFVMKEAAGTKILNSRTCTTMVSTGTPKLEIRSGSKIPYAVSPTNIQQIDVGVSIDLFRIKEDGDRLSFAIVTEVSSVAEAIAGQTNPTIRQNKWTSEVIVPLKKATLLFSSDNLDAKTQLQVEVTATPIP